MQQEFGLVRAQLNLVQQTLNVILEKLDRFEQNQNETTKLLSKLKSEGGDGTKRAQREVSVSTKIKEVGLIENNPTSPPAVNFQYSQQEASSSARPQQDDGNSHSEDTGYFEHFIALALKQANDTNNANTVDKPLGNEIVVEPVAPNQEVWINGSRCRICIECKQLKRISGQNMCHKCYMKKYHAEKRQNLPSQRCVDCNKLTDLKTKTRCRACYIQFKSPVKQPEICIDCGELKKLSGSKRCHPCYMKLYHKVRRINTKKYLKLCKGCRNLRPHYAYGMCEQCYLDFKREETSNDQQQPKEDIESDNLKPVKEELPG